MKIQPLVIAALALTSILHAQPGVDPFRASNAPVVSAAVPEVGVPINISICYEAFSVPMGMAAKLQREAPNDPELYRLLTAAIGKDDARQETFCVLRSKSSQKATTESISEQIYPTEYEPGRLPDSLGVAVTPPIAKQEAPSSKEPKAPEVGTVKEVPSPKKIPDVDASKLRNAPASSELATIAPPATGTAFETRNSGFTLEIEPTLSENNLWVDLRLVPEHVTLVGRTSFGQGVNTTEMPVFESQRINNSITLRVGKPSLLGTISRPPVSQVDPDSANRVWFAFVTATLAKP